MQPETSVHTICGYT